ncbi:alpha-2 adrenergic receptor [Octopus sinensis]|uniref:Alpha-2 adrenergic receptor n=1 Tax=Octopus sinensis TaxID=2607531 RepID=A0A6P7SWB3_9MOLL|nr:alpha-2 adrenergic receptor [Octopus sinensis]
MESSTDSVQNGTMNIIQNITIEELNRQQVLVRIPSTILVILTMIFGFIGNSLTVYVYGFRLKLSPTYLFVVMLACADLIMCAIITPGRIVQNVYPMMTTWDAMCKNHMCLSVFTGLCNCGFLVAIAVDRYRKVCQPLKPQITMKAAKIITACIFIFCATQGSVALLYYGSIKKPTKYPGIYSYSCSSKNSKKPNYYQLGFFAFYLLVTFFTIFLLITFYTIVLRRMRSVIKTSQPVLTSVTNAVSFKSKDDKRKSEAIVNIENPADSSTSNQEIDFVNISTTENVSNTTSSSSGVYSVENAAAQSIKPVEKNPIQKMQSNKTLPRESNSVRRAREQATRVQRTTVTMMMITFIFIVTYIPSVAAMMVNAVLKSESSMSVATAIFYWLARHSFYVNSSINPIIYGCRNQNFVDEVKKLFGIKRK